MRSLKLNILAGGGITSQHVRTESGKLGGHPGPHTTFRAANVLSNTLCFPQHLLALHPAQTPFTSYSQARSFFFFA